MEYSRDGLTFEVTAAGPADAVGPADAAGPTDAVGPADAAGPTTAMPETHPDMVAREILRRVESRRA